MTAVTALPERTSEPAAAEARRVVRAYYLAMAIPCELDIVISAIYCWVHGLWDLFLSNLIMDLVVLLGGAMIMAHRLIRPIADYLFRDGQFTDIQRRLTQLPLLSAQGYVLLYAPLMLFRVLLPKIGVQLDPLIPVATWADIIATLIIQVMFIFVFTYFMISGYLERLCSFLFRSRQVNLDLFFGRFQVKLAVALGFVGIGPLTLVAVEMFSYSGERLMREVAVDLLAAAFGLGVTLYWVATSLARPLARLSSGLQKVAAGDLAVRLPVTSNEEIGQATAQFNRMAAGLRERDFLRETFGKYVSESVATAILKESDGAGHLQGETRSATLLFTDIDGFTTISELMSPAQLIAMLNEYLSIVLEPIQRHGGVVSGFIGDGLFASFNLPASHESHANAAIAAAIDIQDRLNAHQFTDGLRLTTRIGIHTGPVIGGTVGHADRLTYTLLGDAVNTAARLQEMNKTYQTRILVSHETLRLVGENYDAIPVGEVEIRGRVERIPAYSVTGHRTT